MKLRFIAFCLMTTLLFASCLSAQAKERQPKGPAADRNQPKNEGTPAERYTLEQAISDQAQLNTIAFNGLAFLTGTFGADTFLPPGKVADYFGFQYMRDVGCDFAQGFFYSRSLTAGNILEYLERSGTA